MAVGRTVNRPDCTEVRLARRYLCSPLPAPGRHVLPDAVTKHLLVVRVRPGDSIFLFDGAGRQATARVLQVERRRIEVELEAASSVDREPSTRLELAVALPKGARAEWLFEHATELGVARFRPIVFARSQGAMRDERRARWERLVLAATEQCDRSRVPQVDDEIGLEALLADPSLPTERYAARPGAERPLGASHSGAAVLCVGPEGGFTDAELAQLHAAGFEPRSLGALTLRTETAALVGAARLLA